MGMSHSPEYAAWAQMKQRCSNPKNPSYPAYGGRGIRICDQWGEYESFVADMGPRPDGMVLYRIDNDKGYSPDNCRWATKIEQVKNRRNMHYIEYNGLSLTLNEWARHLEVSSATIHKRKLSGLPIERILTGRKYPNANYIKRTKY